MQKENLDEEEFFAVTLKNLGLPTTFKKLFKSTNDSIIHYPTFIQSALFSMFEKNSFWIEAEALSGKTFGALLFAFAKNFLKKEKP